jgi:hypothetical protein
VRGEGGVRWGSGKGWWEKRIMSAGCWNAWDPSCSHNVMLAVERYRKRSTSLTSFNSLSSKLTAN